MADDDLLNAAAEALGVPPEMALRSAEARAEAEGKTTEEVLQAWAGESAEGEPEQPPQPEAAEPAPPSEPSDDEIVAAETAQEPPRDPAVEEEEEEELPAPEAPPAPETVSVDRSEDFEVVTAVPTASIKERTKAGIPGWLGSLFVVLPLLAVLLLLNAQSPECGQAGALGVDPVTGQVVNCDGSEFTGSGPGDGVIDYLAMGVGIYRGQGACFNCHAAGGEGVGAIPALTAVLETFPSCADHQAWITLGSLEWISQVGDTYPDGRPVGPGMPTFGGSLTPEQIASVALYERVEFGRADLTEVLVDCGLAEPEAPDGAPEGEEPPAEDSG